MVWTVSNLHHHLHNGKFLNVWVPRQFPESGIFSDTDKQQTDYLRSRYPPISGQKVPVTHTPLLSSARDQGPTPTGYREERLESLGCVASRTQGGRHYHGVIGEGVGVIDPLSGTVPVSWLAGAGKRRNDLIVVLTAEQLSLTRI